MAINPKELSDVVSRLNRDLRCPCERLGISAFDVRVDFNIDAIKFVYVLNDDPSHKVLRFTLLDRYDLDLRRHEDQEYMEKIITINLGGKLHDPIFTDRNVKMDSCTTFSLDEIEEAKKLIGELNGR